MSSEVGIKIRKLREAENLGRAEFCEITGIPKGTLTNTETGRREPMVGLVESVCGSFPQYAYWLMTGLTDEKAGHISPEIEISRQNLDEEKTG